MFLEDLLYRAKKNYIQLMVSLSICKNVGIIYSAFIKNRRNIKVYVIRKLSMCCGCFVYLTQDSLHFN